MYESVSSTAIVCMQYHNNPYDQKVNQHIFNYKNDSYKGCYYLPVENETDTSVDPALFPAVTEYVVDGETMVGVPEMVHVTGERTSPSGRLTADVNAQDVIAVPPVQTMMMGTIKYESRRLGKYGSKFP